MFFNDKHLPPKITLLSNSVSTTYTFTYLYIYYYCGFNIFENIGNSRNRKFQNYSKLCYVITIVDFGSWLSDTRILNNKLVIPVHALN